MLVKNSNSKINFGWTSDTHIALTQAAASKAIGFNIEALNRACILPDKEPHLPGSHSADITKPRKEDALSSFKKLDKKIKTLIANNENEKLSEYIGKALHYLQDMMNPHHINYKTKLSNNESFNHLKFEEAAVQIQHETINFAKSLPIDEDIDFDSFLNKKMFETKNMSDLILTPISKSKIKTNMKKLQQESLVNSFQVTYEYLSKLSKLLHI